MGSLGSGNLTRAICSTVAAQAFQAIRCPLPPRVDAQIRPGPACPFGIKNVLPVRQHSLFAPRDVDVSPYFVGVKPPLARCFDVCALNWNRDQRAVKVD